MSIFEKIIQRPTLLTVVTLIICVLGVVAAFRIPVQMIPDLDVRVISVRTNWPGATPQDVEKEILVEQEDFLRTLPNLRRLTATASSGRAEIELEFPFGTDTTDMLIRVNNALSQVPSYPENVDEPRIYASSFSSNSFMFFSVTPLEGNPRQLDMDLAKDFIEDNVRPRIASVAGVSEVRVYGGAERQIQILIDPHRLAQRSLTLMDVRRVIRARNQDRSGGEIESGKRRYLLRTIGRFESTDDLSNLILARHGDSVVRLKDVATIKVDHSEKSRTTFFNHDPNLFITIRREAGSNVIDIKRAMMLEITAVNRDILNPAGMKVTLVADDVKYVSESIANVWQNLTLGALLASLVMLLFLRSIKATAVGIVGIPICTIAAFLGLLLVGRSINVISLAGVAFAIGMTLDNSIVVLESIELERGRGVDRFRAAVNGVRQVWPAVLASTLTTVLVFLPVAFIEQEAGQLYSDIGIAISASIMASMLVAITVVPTAAARLSFSARHARAASTLTQTNKGAEPIHSAVIHSVAATRWQRVVLAAIYWLIGTQTRRLSCIAVIILVSIAIIKGLTPAAEYLPEGEEPKIFASMNPPPGYNQAAMSAIGEELREYFLPHLQDDPQRYARGETDVPALAYMNMMVTPSRLRIIAQPKRDGDTDALMNAVTDKYREYPGMRAFAARGSIITSNDGGTRSINLDIAGPRLAVIYEVAQSAYQRAQQVFTNPRIRSTPSALSLSQPMVEIRPNWDRAAELGVTAESLGFTVSALTDGSYVDEFFIADDKVDIYLYSAAGQSATIESLPHLPIYTPSGAAVPLSTLADIKETVDTSSFRRVNGRRTVTLNIIPPADIPLETGVEMVRKDVVQYLRDQGAIPGEINITLSGAADQLEATRDALVSNYLVALLIIYLLLVAIFNHWGFPVLIMMTIPLGIAGGIVGLWLMNAVGGLLPVFGWPAIDQSFDMISMLGFLILMGTVVNNPILILHRAVGNVNERGLEVVDAVKEAVAARLRPIAMSTITTLFGLAPLVLIPGAGTELYRGVGVIVMFGIVGAAFVTLTLLPALTVVVLKISSRGANAKTS